MRKAFYISVLIFSLCISFEFIKLLAFIKGPNIINALDYLVHYINTYTVIKGYYFSAVPNFYSGSYNVFTHYFPFPYFLSAVLFSFAGNLGFVFYSVIVLSFIMSFALIFLVGRHEGFSKQNAVLLSFLAAANPLAISWLYETGRYSEIVAWVFFFASYLILDYYRKKRIDKKFMLLIITSSIAMLSHLSVFIILSFFYVGLFLEKKKGRFIIALTFSIVVVVCSLWLVHFVVSVVFSGLNYPGLYLTFPSKNINLLFPGTKISAFYALMIYSTIVAGVFLLLFFIYSKKFRDWVFYFPLAFFSFLYLTRIAYFIPLINAPWPNTYNISLLFVSFIMFFKIFGKKKYAQIIVLGFAVFSLVLFIFFVNRTYFENPTYYTNFSKILPMVSGKYVLLYNYTFANLPENLGASMYLVYLNGFVKYNLSTSTGPADRSSSEYFVSVNNELQSYFMKGNCEGFNLTSSILGLHDFISVNSSCSFFASCGFKRIYESGQACLYSS